LNYFDIDKEPEIEANNKYVESSRAPVALVFEGIVLAEEQNKFKIMQ